MLKQGLVQKQTQRLSPLQIQTIKLLELPTLELEQKIKKELEENPVLDEVVEETDPEEEKKNVSLSEYSGEDPTPSYKLYVNNQSKDPKPQYNTFSVRESFHQSLQMQLGFCNLDRRSREIASFMIGMLDDDGYLRRDLESLSDDIAFRLGVEVTAQELESLLKVIQGFDPVGVGARDLRECLLLQIATKSPTKDQQLAQTVLQDYFTEFSKKHYSKITAKLNITEQELKGAIDEITRLNPRPGGQIDDSYSEQYQQIVPDFLLEIKDGELVMTMPKSSLPKIKVNKYYEEYFKERERGSSASSSKQDKDTRAFVRQKLDSAKWFVEAIKQRQNTLQNTMNAIIEFQKEYFIDGDESKLRPMVLKNIAEKTGLDISTISRVVNCKYIQTHFGIYPLKYFFSEGMVSNDGEEVSTREIKMILEKSIEQENKQKPLTDEELVSVLDQKGYKVARRTIAKYREQLNIPIARLRKEL